MATVCNVPFLLILHRLIRFKDLPLLPPDITVGLYCRNVVGLDEKNIKCNLQYQTSDVRVYTKFYTVHERRDVYMRGGKVQVFADITSHVSHLIQTSNKDVVKFEGGLLRGVGPGKATVKVR